MKIFLFIWLSCFPKVDRSPFWNQNVPFIQGNNCIQLDSTDYSWKDWGYYHNKGNEYNHSFEFFRCKKEKDVIDAYNKFKHKPNFIFYLSKDGYKEVFVDPIYSITFDTLIYLNSNPRKIADIKETKTRTGWKIRYLPDNSHIEYKAFQKPFKDTVIKIGELDSILNITVSDSIKFISTRLICDTIKVLDDAIIPMYMIVDTVINGDSLQILKQPFK